MSGNHADVSTYTVKGTAAQARAWVGREVRREASFPISESQIGDFCALVEDPDQNYWDTEAARRRYGSLISPPGMLMVWAFPPPWNPAGRPQHAPLLALEVPLPGTTLINVSTDSTFHQPMRVGDRPVYVERLTSLSEEKHTALGSGYFLTTRTECHHPDGTLLATNDNVLFRYTPAEASSASPSAASTPRAPGQHASTELHLPIGEPLPSVSMPVTIGRCVLDAAATRDFFPGHHDREYARAQGARDAYLNTMFFHGLVDRVAKAWAGPDAWLARRTLRMVTPVCVGDILRTDGRVSAIETHDGVRLARLAVDVHTDHGPATQSEVVMHLDGVRDPGL